MTNENDQPDLIPYASHVAHGTGRTPIGIILFAAWHLLMGGVLAFVLVNIVRRYTVVLPHQMISRLLLAGTAAMMIAGGTVLLLKGRLAWFCSHACFYVLALLHAGNAAHLMWWSARYQANALGNGLGLLSVAFALFVLCVIVLGYLAAPKSRDTFALPPGESPTILRWLPKMMIVVFLAAVAAGYVVGRR
jgi:hypothetical protein